MIQFEISNHLYLYLVYRKDLITRFRGKRLFKGVLIKKKIIEIDISETKVDKFPKREEIE